MTYSITHRNGARERDPRSSALDALVAELDRADSEHPDVAVSHQTGWTLSAFASGRLIYENVEDDNIPPREMVVERTVLRELFGALAEGDFRRLESQDWRSRVGDIQTTLCDRRVVPEGMDRGNSSAVPDDLVLIALGTRGQSLVVRVTGPAAPKAIIATERAWRNATIEIDAAPFSGVIHTVLTSSDLEQYRAAMEGLAASGHAVIGGGRAPRIELSRDGSVIEVSVSPTGDDPWPTIRYLVFPQS